MRMEDTRQPPCFFDQASQQAKSFIIETIDKKPAYTRKNLQTHPPLPRANFLQKPECQGV